MSVKLKIVAAVFGFVFFATPAFADAIDGDWCHTPDSRRLSIRGPEIVTPGGARLRGDYGRHSFSYAAPASEPGAGKTVFMTLLDENTVHLRLGEAFAANPETWIRCSPSTSSIGLPPPV